MIPARAGWYRRESSSLAAGRPWLWSSRILFLGVVSRYSRTFARFLSQRTESHRAFCGLDLEERLSLLRPNIELPGIVCDLLTDSLRFRLVADRKYHKMGVSVWWLPIRCRRRKPELMVFYGCGADGRPTVRDIVPVPDRPRSPALTKIYDSMLNSQNPGTQS